MSFVFICQGFPNHFTSALISQYADVYDRLQYINREYTAVVLRSTRLDASHGLQTEPKQQQNQILLITPSLEPPGMRLNQR